MLTYKKMIAITKDMVRDEKWGLINKMVRSIGRSAKETQMQNAFSVYNNAFSSSFPGSDAVALISASHPSPVGNQSNTLATQADLSYSALQEAEQVFVKTKDQVGKQLDIMPAILVVAPFNMHTAKETVGSPFAPGTANNNISSVMQYELAVSPYLTDADAWFLQSVPSDHGMRIFERQPLETESDFDKKAHVLYYIGDYREAVGADQWRGIVGSDGSAA
jgi:phage major head subunit gpT-like protein